MATQSLDTPLDEVGLVSLMVRTFPDRLVATITKAKRKGRILIDFFRNAEGATAVAPYAVRSRSRRLRSRFG